MKIYLKTGFFLCLIGFFSCSGQNNNDPVDNAKFNTVWKMYHEDLFHLGLKQKVTNEEKKALLGKIGKKHYIPEFKLKSFISQKYPKYFKSLYGAEINTE